MEMDFLEGAAREAKRDFDTFSRHCCRTSRSWRRRFWRFSTRRRRGRWFVFDIDGGGTAVGVLVPELPFFGVTLGDGGSVPAEFDGAGVISAVAHFAFALDFAPAAVATLVKGLSEVVVMRGRRAHAQAYQSLCRRILNLIIQI